MKYSSIKSSNEKIIKNKLISLIDSILYSIWFHVWFQLLNYSLSLILLTTHEKEKLNKSVEQNILKFIFTIILTIIITPVGLLFLILWVVVVRVVFRETPYSISIKSEVEKDQLIFDANKTYQILSTNVCLLPEFLARINNLNETDKRLIEVSKILTGAVRNDSDSLSTELNTDDSLFIEIIDDFSKHSENVDFICFQEIWTVRHSKKLKDLLHHKYPYIVYDIGINTIKSNCLIGLDSGLMFASKYPILNIEFKTFGQKMNACRFSSKGLLMAKVFLGLSRNNKRFIGFISNTHLQSYQEMSKIHSLQMDEMMTWLNEFRAKHYDYDGETIAFDLICGDFNMDNYSPVDLEDFNHSMLKAYVDPLCIKPGLDHEFAIGTEMRQYSLYDDIISTPQKFKKVLLNERLRRSYVFDANIKTATFEMLAERPQISNEDGLPILLPDVSGKRRVDRILYNQEYSVNVEKYKFLSSMPRLTDHIPISMEFKCRI